ncbi:MAG: hypothetical protein EXS52_00915, partial [Candidatus Staskawiczbacteria bacterium]|nr:hypothetical protein [Candidatus Staskawiczbacteria bacterium]
GKYNIDSNDYAFIVGNGSGSSDRDNAFGVSMAGGVYIPDIVSCTDLQTDANAKIVCGLSSGRYKENINDLSFDREKFLSLRPVSFEYKEDLSFKIPGAQMGFIAEEVEKIFPDLVKYNKDNQVESVKYDRLPVYLYEIVQEQQKDIELLKTLTGLSLNSDGLTGESNLTFNGYHSLLDSVRQLVALSGIVIEDGVTKVKGLVTDKAKIKTARIERLEMVDSKTGDIYCTWLADGEWQKAKGECMLISGIPPEFPETFPSSPAEAIDQIEEIKKTTEHLQNIANQATKTVNEAQSTVQEAKDIIEESNENIDDIAQKAADEAVQKANDQAEEEAKQKAEKEAKKQLEEQAQQSLEKSPVEEVPVEETTPAPESDQETSSVEESSAEPVESSVGGLILNASSTLMDKMLQFMGWMFAEITPVSVKQSGINLLSVIKNSGSVIAQVPQKTPTILQKSTEGLMAPIKDLGQFIIEFIFH